MTILMFEPCFQYRTFGCNFGVPSVREHEQDSCRYEGFINQSVMKRTKGLQTFV